MKTISGIVGLKPGQVSHRVDERGSSSQIPISGRCEIMGQGANASNIFGTLDWTSLSRSGGVFNFTSPIPNDGLTYKMYYEFTT